MAKAGWLPASARAAIPKLDAAAVIPATPSMLSMRLKAFIAPTKKTTVTTPSSQLGPVV
jgi:hypothetical protein